MSKGFGNGKSVAKGKSPEQVSQLSSAEQQMVLDALAIRAQGERREIVGESRYTGTVKWIGNSHGWISPSDFQALPDSVQWQTSVMTAEHKKRREGKGKRSDLFDQNVLYFRVFDRSSLDINICAGMDVSFQVYVDDKGAGANDVIPLQLLQSQAVTY